MTCIAYVDGFNLYYRALKRRPHLKWLNLVRLSRRFLDPADELLAVKYFTARVSGKRDPEAPKRQNLYIEALKTEPIVQVFYGKFLPKEITRPLADSPISEERFVRVRTTEEKGSDVNLATELLVDTFWGGGRRIGKAIVVTGDTDLVAPIEAAVKKGGVKVLLIHPDIDRPVPSPLRSVCSAVRHLAVKDLKESQFPPVVERPGRGPVKCPESWSES